MWQPCGLATGIGSLPFIEPEEAAELIYRYIPFVPHWPQLPRRGTSEGFILQFLFPLLETGVLRREAEKAYFATDAPDWAERLAAFYELYLAAEEGDEAALARFGTPREAAAGLYTFLETAPGRLQEATAVKGQVVGPLTVGFSLNDARRRPAYYDEQLRDVIVKTLTLNARWQVRILADTGKPVLLFIDEPGVSIYGQSTYITVTREMILNDLAEMVRAVGDTGGMCGIHSCAAVDWSILMDAGPTIVSFDAYNYFSSLIPYASELAAFLAGGGILAWGIVPTSERVLEENVTSLLKRLESQWGELAARGIEGDTLRRQCLVTPSCGLGLLTEDLAHRIYAVTAGVAAAVRGE
ncbi:MAG: hypothetical protein ACUVRC_08040 [Desulfotomaculales bacterium]